MYRGEFSYVGWLQIAWTLQRDLEVGEMGLRREQIRNSDCVRLRATGTAEADRRVARVHAPGETAICIDFPFRPHQGRVLPSEARLRVRRTATTHSQRRPHR